MMYKNLTGQPRGGAGRCTARLDFSSRATAEADLARTHALDEAREAEDAGIRLTLP